MSSTLNVKVLKRPYTVSFSKDKEVYTLKLRHVTYEHQNEGICMVIESTLGELAKVLVTEYNQYLFWDTLKLHLALLSLTAIEIERTLYEVHKAFLDRNMRTWSGDSHYQYIKNILN